MHFIFCSKFRHRVVPGEGHPAGRIHADSLSNCQRQKMVRPVGCPNSLPAFTLVELLVTVGIIATLCALAYGGYNMAVAQARKAKEIAAARTLVSAYLNYPTDNQGDLMPGYLPGASVTLPDGETVSGPTAERYPWRLAEYGELDVRETMLLNPGKQGAQTSGSGYHYMVSLAPSLGMNAYCIGGYRTTTGLIAKRDCASNMAHLGQADQDLVVFASAQQTQGGNPLEGNFLVKPPTMIATTGIHYRHGGKAVVAYIDGHVETNTEEELQDARRWSAFADSESYRIRP